MAGLAGAAHGDVDVLIGGYAYGSLSMTACTLGLTCPMPRAQADLRSRPPICPPTSQTSKPASCAGTMGW